MRTNDNKGFYFVAITPGRTLGSLVLDFKETVRTTVGEQLYLNDPPHLTVYLSNFQDQSRLFHEFSLLRDDIGQKLPSLEVAGWKVFEADVLTGNQTIVLKLTEATQSALRAIQALVLQRLSCLCDLQRSHLRYLSSWERLSSERQKSVQQCGFPFTGDDWQPHVTVASITQKDWPRAWQALENHDVWGTFGDCQMTLYQLDEENHPSEIKIST